jgi:uncharacterized protein YjiS (DUF1127 family)
MQTTGTASAGRSATATVLRPADRTFIEPPRRRWTSIRLVGGAIRWLARLLKGLRPRRRPRLEGWMSMDPRVMADIGVTRADVQAVLYAGVPIERLGAKRRLPHSTGAIVQPCRPVPRLRLVVADDLDAAA